MDNNMVITALDPFYGQIIETNRKALQELVNKINDGEIRTMYDFRSEIGYPIPWDKPGAHELILNLELDTSMTGDGKPYIYLNFNIPEEED